MNGYERKIRITNSLKSEENVRINDLAERFGVTKVTIRSDLDDLEKRGLLIRTHGGAVIAENQHLVRLVEKTIHERPKEKEAIARLASTLVEPDSTVVIDSGSTTSYLARYIKDKRFTVITNSLIVLQQLSVSDSIELMVPGGALRKPSMALIGHVSRTFFEHINADLVFLGATSFSLEKGMSCTNLIEAQTKQNMVRSGLSVCLLVDSSKANKVSMAHICDWDDIDILVTDSIDPEYEKSLKQKGVKIMTPGT